ncbi:metallophosphoesterase family protein [Actinomadura scrupuli]|uniref:metallophosphoesterase family protein n=1 Tax=Actinomadura scrupuli TaxID=559629 RepID=UPI003D95AC63
MKILHAADLHIDSPLHGLSRYEGAPVESLRLASRGALQNLVDLALMLPVGAVLLAGDIYDGDWRDYQTGLFFSGQMSRLRQAGIPVYLVSGNHDAKNRTMKGLRLPENVNVLDTAEPQTIRNENAGLAVHGQGFARWDLTENLAAEYPLRDSGLFNVGLLHTALTGNPDHGKYAPCEVDDLVGKGYDYWALGHIHARKVVTQEPWIVFPGNLQGRNAREIGPKGCTVVTVDGNLRVLSVEHHDLDVARWEHLIVDVSAATDHEYALDLVQAAMRELPDDRLHAVRVTLTGRTPAHRQLWQRQVQMIAELRNVANDFGNLWMEKLHVGTCSEHIPSPGLAGVLADLQRTAADLGADPDRLMQMINDTPLMRAALPAQARGRHRVEPDNVDWVRRIGDEALELLESLLMESR